MLVESETRRNRGTMVMMTMTMLSTKSVSCLPVSLQQRQNLLQSLVSLRGGDDDSMNLHDNADVYPLAHADTKNTTRKRQEKTTTTTTTTKKTKKRNNTKRRKRRSLDDASALSLQHSSKSSGSGRRNAQQAGKQGECLRRIKREWKDAVKLGIAYDWKTMQTITSKGRSSKNGGPSSSQYNYVRMGPYGKNLLRWHFSVLGPSNSPYSEGIYHGRILLPKNYPMSPPRVQMLTPSGRFVPGEDICLSASNYHPETWTPRWTILSLIDALRLHMLTTPNEIGGIDSTREKRMELAVQSRRWKAGSIDHGRMVQCGIFCEKIMTHNDDDNVMKSNNVVEDSSDLERSIESNHQTQVFLTTDTNNVRKKRTLVQQIVLFSFNIFVEVCKSPYFPLLILFLVLSQYLLHHCYS
jgi:ubiquitin-protein ligase